MPLFGTTNLLSSPLSHSLSLSKPTITSQSSVICQGLHSLDSQTTDTNTTLRLKLSLPLQEMNKNPSNPNLGIWNSLQSLSPSSRTPKQEGTYAHPILTEKSLELCTENLGSETGSDTDFSLSSPDFGGGNGEISTVGKPNSYLEKECKIVTGQCADKLAWRAELPRKEMEGRKVNFPPPLTTLSGSGSVRVRARREEGRLIVKAVGGPLENSTSTSFRAERSNGRLRLCFWEEDWDSDEMDFQENQESEIYVEGSGEEEEEEEEDEDEDEESEDMSGNDMDVEGEMGMKKFERPRWCKMSGECGNGSLWPSWVATS